MTRLPAAPHRIRLPGGVCDEGHSALDLTPFASLQMSAFGGKADLVRTRLDVRY